MFGGWLCIFYTDGSISIFPLVVFSTLFSTPTTRGLLTPYSLTLLHSDGNSSVLIWHWFWLPVLGLCIKGLCSKHLIVLSCSPSYTVGAAPCIDPSSQIVLLPFPKSNHIFSFCRVSNPSLSLEEKGNQMSPSLCSRPKLGHLLQWPRYLQPFSVSSATVLLHFSSKPAPLLISLYFLALRPVWRKSKIKVLQLTKWKSKYEICIRLHLFLTAAEAFLHENECSWSSSWKWCSWSSFLLIQNTFLWKLALVKQWSLTVGTLLVN